MFRYVLLSGLLPLVLVAVPGLVLADEPEGVVELVPDNPGPYVGGETVQIHVWVHSLVDFDAQFHWVQFDFRDTSPQIVLSELFTFDYSTLDHPHGFEEGHLLPEVSFGPPYLPVPFTSNGWAIACYPCGDVFFVIPPQGSFHIGSFGLQVPTTPGSYRLDVMNADEPDQEYGAMLSLEYGPASPDNWNASTGELIGGARTLVVAGPVPAISGPWAAVLTVALVGTGVIVMHKRVAWAVPYLAVPTLLTAFVLGAPVCVHADEPAVIIELIPNNPGPHVGGRTFTVHLAAQPRQLLRGVRVRAIRLPRLRSSVTRGRDHCLRLVDPWRELVLYYRRPTTRRPSHALSRGGRFACRGTAWQDTA